MDAREQLNLVTDECNEFLAKPDFRERPTEYFALLGKLKTLVNSHTIPNDVRLDAYLIRNTMKWSFNSVVGAVLTNRNTNQFKLYGHESLTSKCRVKAAELNVGAIGYIALPVLSKLVMAMRLALK